MSRFVAKISITTPTESLILRSLARILPPAAYGYEQALLDLTDAHRRSYRGVAHELREVLRETLDHLAPDVEVMADPDFDLEAGMTRPTQRQKALYVLHKRKRTKEEASGSELTVNLVDELSARIIRVSYRRGAKDAHTICSAAEVRQLKMWIDAVLGELLQIHQHKILRSGMRPI